MNSNRKNTILTHIASWAALVVVPLMTTGHGEGLTPRHVCISVGVTLAFMTVFYTNFLWITPRYYTKGCGQYFVLFNTVVIVTIAVALHFWIDACNTFYPNPKSRFHSEGLQLSFILRDMFNLAIVAVVGTALHLASRWRKTEEARLEAEAARADAELRTLRNQINPHFLLNTLNNIYALAAIDSTRAQEAIQQLSKMLRHLLYDNEQPFVPLKDEVEFIQNYVSLMRIRLPKSVDVDCNVSVGNEQQPVAPMLFISLLENAFKHGISPTMPSFIRLQLTADDSHICCNIENSNHPKTEQDRSGHGIGLQQVQRRLDLAYPGHYTWQRGVTADGKTYQSKIDITL